MSNTASANLRFLLWQRQIPQSEWVGEVTRWVGCSEARAEQLLRGAATSAQESKKIAEGTQVAEDEILYSDLMEEAKIDIWQENVLHLLATLKHGNHRKLADFLNLDGGTISKWKKRVHRPEIKFNRQLHHFFEVSIAFDLELHPLFLSFSPSYGISQRNWLHGQIDQLSGQTLQELFPALERLLQDP
jgi:transcriptional regulator with XRE-family HTH domain